MNTLIAQVSKSISATAASATDSASNGALQLMSSLFVYGQKFITTGVILIGSYVIGKIIATRVINRIQENRGDTLYLDLENLIRRSIVYGSLFVGGAASLQFIFGIDFLQIVGFFGLGIGFAFKDLLSNLIAGVVVILQNRFHVGDLVNIGGNLFGKIMEIQTRATILKAIDGTEIIVPNADLLKKKVQTYTAHHTRRITIPVNVHYSTNIRLAIGLLELIMRKNQYVLKKPEPKALVIAFGESAIELKAHFHIDPQDKKKSWLYIKSDIIQEIQKAFEENGINIPYPQRTIYRAAPTEGKEWVEKGDKKLMMKKKKKKAVTHLAPPLTLSTISTEKKEVESSLQKVSQPTLPGATSSPDQKILPGQPDQTIGQSQNSQNGEIVGYLSSDQTIGQRQNSQNSQPSLQGPEEVPQPTGSIKVDGESQTE